VKARFFFTLAFKLDVALVITELTAVLVCLLGSWRETLTLQVVDFVLKEHVICFQLGKQALDVLKLKTTDL
jgi:hypothetical protein